MLQLRLQGTFPWFGGGAGQAKQSDPLHHHIFLPRSLLPQFTLLQQERSIFWLFGQAVTSTLASAHVLEIFPFAPSPSPPPPPTSAYVTNAKLVYCVTSL